MRIGATISASSEQTTLVVKVDSGLSVWERRIPNPKFHGGVVISWCITHNAGNGMEFDGLTLL